MASDFPKLWNLAYYNGKSDMYFYFNSLWKPWSGHEDYNSRAEWIAADAASSLNQIPSFATDQSTFEIGYLYDLIQFMEQAVQTERAAEAAYFTNQIKQLNSPLFKDVPEVQKLIEEFNKSSEGFNYENVIPLINLIYQGLENTKAIARAETEHIEEIEKGMKHIRGDDDTTRRFNTLEGLWNSTKSGRLHEKYKTFEKFLEASNKKRNRDIMISYTSHGNLGSSYDDASRKLIPGVKKWLLDNDALKSTDVKIGKWITDSINEIINNQETFDSIMATCKSRYNFNSKSQTQVEKAVKSFLVQGITAYATQHIDEILNDTYQNQDINKLAQLVIESIEIVDNIKIEGLYDNFGQFGTSLKLFENAATVKDLQNEKRSAEGLYDAYKAFRKELGRIKRDKNLKANQSQILLRKMLKTGAKEDEYSEIYRLIQKLESLETKLDKYKGNDKKIQQILQNWNDKPLTLTDTAGETFELRLQLKTDGTFDLSALRNALKNSQVMEKLGGPGNKSKTLSTFISRLKSKTSTTLKQDIISSIGPLVKAAQKKGLGGEEHIINSIKNALANMKISVGGPTFSEVKQGFQQSLQGSKDLLSWTGKINRKNDFITIGVNWTQPSFEKALRRSAEINATNIVENSRDVVEKVSKILFKNFQDTFYDTITDLNKTDSTVNSYKNNAQAFFQALEERNEMLATLNTMQTETNAEWEQFAKQAQHLNITEDDLFKQREAIIKGIENSFFVSSTMKTYNQYQDKIGFVGGSLGGNILDQLNNFSELMESAGMPISTSDFEWLYSAIINCSPVSIVGESKKNLIENCLGSMAAFALFDEGGAEAQIINNILHNVKDKYSTPQILHIYAVNGVYHPGSYVLQQVVDELKLCLENVGQAYESTHRGAGITIINTMNEGMIPNRGKGNIDHDEKGRPVARDTDPWGTVANHTWDAVSIKILFLAGLLDTVQNINNKLGNIELPK